MDPTIIEERIRALSPTQQRELLTLLRQRNTTGVPSSEGAISQAYGTPYQAPATPEVDKPLWQDVANWLFKPFELIQEHAFTPIAAASKEGQQNPLEAGLQAGVPLYTAIKGITGYQPGSEKREEYETWKEGASRAEKAATFVAENALWAVTPSALGTAAKLKTLGKVGEVAGKVIEKSPYGQWEKGVAAAAKALKESRPAAVQKFLGLADDIKKATKETKALQKAELGPKLAEVGKIRTKYTAEQARVSAGEALAGKLSAAETKLAENFTPDDVHGLREYVRLSEALDETDWLHADDALTRIFTEKKPLRDFEIEVLGKAFGSEVASALKAVKKAGRWDLVVDALNAPRAVLASVDLSAPGRQGLILSLRHPVMAFQSFGRSLKAFASETYANYMDDIINARSHTAAGKKFNLEYTAPVGKSGRTHAEEMFYSTIAEKLPLVKRSERAYTMFLTDLRSQVWEHTYPVFQKMGGSDKDFRELAKLVNVASGRGDIKALSGALKNAGPLINALFFAPKYVISQFQLPAMLFSKSALVRKEAAKELALFLGTGSGILSLAKLTGLADVDLDPRSSDFAKLRIGNTRFDIWRGYAQYGRFAAQMLTGERKTSSGYIQKMKLSEIASRMARSKSSPGAGLLIDLLEGQDYMGTPLTEKTMNEIGYEKLVPLFLQDLVEAIDQEGTKGAAYAAPAFFGVGVTSYSNPIDRIRNQVAEDQYGLSWDEVGEKYGKKAQNELEVASPEIQQAIEDLQTSYAQTYKTDTTLWSDWYAYGKGIDESYRNAIALACQEFRLTGDGVTFRDKVNSAEYARRTMYDSREGDVRFAEIVEQLSKPPDASMNEKDVARYAYYKTMYSDDMYDTFGNYRFDEAEKRRSEFIKQFGSDALQYIQEYSTSRWDEPPEMQAFREAKEVLRPYWQVEDWAWSQVQGGTQLKGMSDKIKVIERTDPDKAKDLLKRFPQILWVRKKVAELRKQMKDANPMMQQALSIYYGY